MIKKDYLEFNKYHFKNSARQKKLRFITISIWPVMDIFSNVIYNRPFDGYFAFSFILTCIFSALSVPLLFLLLMKLSVNHTYKDNQYNDFFMEKTYRIDKSGIEEQSNTKSSKFSWESIVNTVETNNSYYLYLNSVTAIILAKEWISQNDKVKLDVYFK
jgi:hypothetical protein